MQSHPLCRMCFGQHQVTSSLVPRLFLVEERGNESGDKARPHQLHVGVTRKWGLLSHAQNATRWLALFQQLVVMHVLCMW